jgi:hypothetical protein
MERKYLQIVYISSNKAYAIKKQSGEKGYYRDMMYSWKKIGNDWCYDKLSWQK